MLRQVLVSSSVVGLAIAILAISNVLHDRKAAGVLSRRLASAIGGLAFLVAALFLDMPVGLAVLGGLTVLIIVLRLGSRSRLRGVAGSRRTQSWAEVTFAVAGTLSLAIGWGLLGEKWLGLVPALYMAWGDNAAGLMRDTLCRNRPTSWWVSITMLAVCLACAGLVHPYFIGAVGAAVATVAERFRPVLSFWDDNLNLVTASFAAMAILMKVVL
jgi:dolichol kinase